MGKIHFLFGLHSHQPVGNFGSVFAQAYERCYLPIVQHLDRFPHVRATLHFSGCLLEWIEAERPEFFRIVRGLVDRGQVEILGGGMYEPILSTLTPEDALGQILHYSEYVHERFGATVRGLWLTERIWEPTLPSLLARADIRFTLVDETHFHYAGVRKEAMHGYYVTEDRGHTLAVFPIDKELRYRIPFALPENVIGYFGQVAERGRGRAAVYGDDGEKFGVWPKTHAWVYGERWLARFFDALTNNRDWILSTHFGQYLDTNPPLGRVYLPTASYEEMMEWALPAEATEILEDLVRELKASGQYERFRPFLRGGFWPNFFSKYPEANRMHKKMLDVARLVRATFSDRTADPAGALPEAVRELYRSQCNCAYWHGLFGGLYLNYLRHAVYSCMLRAENLADERLAAEGCPRPVAEARDLDADGREEIVVTGRALGLVVKPDSGGAVDLLAARPQAFMLSNTLSRRREAYHRKIVAAGQGSSDEGQGPKSIHDLARAKEEGLERALVYDAHDRRCFQDRFLPEDADLEAFVRASFAELGDFLAGPYRVESLGTEGRTVQAVLVREGRLVREEVDFPAAIRKTFSIAPDAGEMTVAYRITSGTDRALRCRFGCEQNLTLLAGDAADRYYLIDGKKSEPPHMRSIGETRGVRSVALVDDFFDVRAEFSAARPFTLWRFPVETVSQSEDGFERTYQGSALLLLWEFELPPGGSFDVAVRLAVGRAR